MENSLSALTYKGSISEAILESKKQKKLFVVYISEGIVGAEALASSLEKAWLNLHIQETTATVLTAALTSKKPEPSAGFSDISSSEQGSSSGTVVPPPLVDKHEQSSDGGPSATSETIEENNSHEHIVERKTKGLSSPLRLDPDSPVADGLSSSNEDEHPDQEKIINQYSVVPGGDSQLVTTETIEATQRSGECVDDRKTNTLDDDKSVNALSEVHLNIRLPSGISLQDKFSVKSTLGMIKDYVDRNQPSEIGSYDLAIPYPRKVFSDQGPNPALQNNLTRSERPYSSYSPNQSTSSTGRNDNRSRQPTTSHFGSNIHTLKHDEDDSQFGDRNPFWNGNSTQYGGNSDGK
ncbi:hypothetical protein GH714_009401 [Hevea brasiliensis]|uniref:UBX domain-containing protein n=1 Tax=Hevea brasiliensis TaxID=3981 RepID=A0A6A6LHZ0_HEVBR|nr:hypothetical protein GH714_009401 [Hevea brasiliensis]